MKLKDAGIVCLLVLVCALIYVHAQSTSPASSTGANGRYQIVPIDFDYPSHEESPQHKTAMKIDTQTGRTWELIEFKTMDNAPHLGWAERAEIK